MAYIETYYLIDYENVHGDGLSGCQDLGKTDHIVIFFTQNARNIDMSDISNHGEAGLEMTEVPAGKQSADMHIGSYLGYLAGKSGKNCNVVIVSNDTDFDNVIEFWKQKTGISATRAQQIKKKSASNKQVKTVQPTITKKATPKVSGTRKTKLNQEVMQAVRGAGFNADAANTVAQIAAGVYGDEHMLLEVHNALQERYPHYLEAYGAIRSVLSKYADDMQSQSNAVSVTLKDKTAANAEIQKILSKAGFSKDIIAYVASTVVKNLGDKNGKQQTYRSIISQYGRNKGMAIYNCIRKHI